MIKTIRYFGLCLLIISTLMFFYLFSYSVIKESSVSLSDQYAVLLLSTQRDGFPGTDYHALFSKMHLVSADVYLDAKASAAEQQSKIQQGVSQINGKSVILVAWKDAYAPAMSASLAREDIAALILLA